MAVLQLYDTPWLVKSFSLRDICFLKDTKGNYLLDRPFVSLPITAGGLHQAQPAHRRRLVKNEIVLALGIALFELSYAKPLHDLVEPFDFDENGHHDSMTEYSTANRLAKEIHLRELPNYAKAVFRCVHCNFDSFSYDLSDQEFRERFYEGVVVPLREDWEYAMK
ncbi:uncharacterized protein A1O5_06179 [Cladophialophora psammophila CBS 110553]|uniref:DUF7580 domain-containing protein n=1 Tax=Cladophialophora psammophila CBS 110553 TaxID=1182543 RepID=W9X1I0_9EURO|nr:uncharacterized protein A1O5_06179 [Cladophialophora psammophila CBS 110553]EXJ71185.1 hypothetical protein A1O5_06179 [Cladophialophora psammophila CBS 110553]